jgi:hypothetical protein
MARIFDTRHSESAEQIIAKALRIDELDRDIRLLDHGGIIRGDRLRGLRDRQAAQIDLADQRQVDRAVAGDENAAGPVANARRRC